MKLSIGIGFVVLATTLLGCAPRADDLLALSAEAEAVATRLGGDPTFAESEVGVEGNWTLVLVPNSASSESLRGTGLSADDAARIDRRSKSFKEEHCVVFISHGAIAFAEWPMSKLINGPLLPMRLDHTSVPDGSYLEMSNRGFE